MIPGWMERVAWSKENRWKDNEITRRLLDLFDEDIAIMIWDQYGCNSLKMLDGSFEKDTFTLLQKLKYLLQVKRYKSPMEQIIEKIKTQVGRREIELWLFNPWSN
jgi:hypothetical protein